MEIVEHIDSKVNIPPPAAETGRFNTGQVVLMASAHGVSDTYIAFLPPLLPLLIEKLALSKTEAGLLAVFWQGPAVFQPIYGYLADRISLRWLVILAPAISAALVTMVGLAPSYGIIAMLLLFAGFNSAGLHAVAPAMISHYSGKQISKGMSYFMVGGGLGFALGPVLVVLALSFVGLSGLPWLMLLGVSVSLMLFLRIKEDPGKKAQAAAAQNGWLAFRRMFPVMLPLTGLMFLTAFLMVNTGTYLPTFLTGEGVNFGLAGFSFSIVELAGTGGALLSGWLGDRIGQRLVLILSAVATPLLALLFLSVHGWIQFPALAAIGFAANFSQPTMMALVQENFPTNRALANGIYMGSSFVTRSLVTVIVGVLADQFGMRPVFTASAFVALGALPFVFLLPHRN